MIKKIFIKQLNQIIIINQPYIALKFSDAECYREFCYNIGNSIIYSINNEEENCSNILFIKDPMNIDINNKKILTALYKKIIQYIDLNLKEHISLIENEIFKLLDELIYQTNYELYYDGEIDINKILGMYQLSLKQNKDNNYLEFLVNYIKLNIELNDSSLIISFGLIKILTKNELELLKKELKLLNISLVDIIIETTNLSRISYLNVDSEWNVF
ncbi:MAG: type II-A CRISPR-associated protein Csn2 [Staphylococcus sp.]|nr:type II-A CRISPR-associated protein Csn2 [Staphylococcus sp.]